MNSTVRRHIEVRQHLYAATTSMVIALSFVTVLSFDRWLPFEYLQTTIRPDPAQPGKPIIVHRNVNWRRQCEGVAWTEIVSSDSVVTVYDRGVRYPAFIGHTTTERKITLPIAMPEGPATYRGVIKFNKCGLTSRWWPLEVEYQQINNFLSAKDSVGNDEA